MHFLVKTRNFHTNHFVLMFPFVSHYSHLFRMQVYHLFGWFWVMNFIMALGMCVLAGAFASYYWAWDKKTVSVIKGAQLLWMTVLKSLA